MLKYNQFSCIYRVLLFQSVNSIFAMASIFFAFNAARLFADRTADGDQ